MYELVRSDGGKAKAETFVLPAHILLFSSSVQKIGENRLMTSFLVPLESEWHIRNNTEPLFEGN